MLSQHSYLMMKKQHISRKNKHRECFTDHKLELSFIKSKSIQTDRKYEKKTKIMKDHKQYSNAK